MDCSPPGSSVQGVSPARVPEWVVFTTEPSGKPMDAEKTLMEKTHWKRPWWWEKLKEEGEEDDGGWDGWMESLDKFEQTPGDGEGQGSLERCSPWGRKESDTTERLKNNRNMHTHAYNRTMCIWVKRLLWIHVRNERQGIRPMPSVLTWAPALTHPTLPSWLHSGLFLNMASSGRPPACSHPDEFVCLSRHWLVQTPHRTESSRTGSKSTVCTPCSQPLT